MPATHYGAHHNLTVHPVCNHSSWGLLGHDAA